MKSLTACAAGQENHRCGDDQPNADVMGSEHRLFTEWCNAISHSLNDVFSLPRDFNSLKAQVVTAVTRSLDRRMKFDACSVLDVRILDGRHAAESEHRDIN